MDTIQFSSFPLMLQEAPGSNAVAGFITCEQQDFGLRIVLAEPAAKRARKAEAAVPVARLEYSDELAALLQGYEAAVAKKVAQARDAGELLTELCDLVVHALRAKQSATAGSGGAMPMHPASYYARLVAEVESLSQSGALLSVNAQLDEIKLQVRDVAGRQHCVTATLPLDYPNSPPALFADLPEALSMSGAWDASSSGLAAVCAKLAEQVALYQNLWDALDDLDRNTWVLEPENPSRSSCMRRIAVAPHCSVQLHVAPLTPLRVPQLRFLGADKAVQPLVSAFNARAQVWSIFDVRAIAGNILTGALLMQLWDQDGSLRSNLERVLDVVLPSAATGRDRQDYIDDHCGICYEYRLSEAVPDVVCSNARCAKAFHRLCLYDWLRAIPASKQSFASVFGACPFCETAISVSSAVRM